MSNNRLLLLCLEGLSVEEAATFFARFEPLLSLLQQGSLIPLCHSPVSSFQSVWSEILWGMPWWQLGAAGYGTPRASLNNCAPLKESDLPPVPALLAGSGKSITVNLPLLEPKPERRVWLSDGSLPVGLVVSPNELASVAPFKEYQPRAFSCVPYASTQLVKNVVRCLDVERTRLQCVEELLQKPAWNPAIVRLTVFDELYHLLGASLFDRDLLFADQINDFCSELSSFVERVVQLKDVRAGIVSTVGHTACRARVNLNVILQQGNFCKLTENAGERKILSRRRAAALSAVARTERQEVAEATPSWTLASGSSLCGSTTQGAIHLNLKSRYRDGIVEDSAAAELISQISKYICATFLDELGMEPEIWRAETAGDLGPDLMVYLEGIEFHNSATSVAVDTSNKPRSTHTSAGFAWLPPDTNPGKQISPLELHKILAAMANG